MSNGIISFPDIPKQLNEMYDFIKKVAGDLRSLKRELSKRELKKLVTNFKTGVETINLICIKISAKYEVAKRTNREVHISAVERKDIENRIGTLTKELNSIVETPTMKAFLRENPQLSEKAYIKLYGEGVDEYEDLEPKPSEEEAEQKFLDWITDIKWYIGDLLFELDEAIQKSF